MSERGGDFGVVVARNLVCAGCGYNLRTLLSSGRCPECNLLIADSVAAEREAMGRQKIRVGFLGVALGLQFLATVLAFVVKLPWFSWPHAEFYLHFLVGGALLRMLLRAGSFYFLAGMEVMPRRSYWFRGAMLILFFVGVAVFAYTLIWAISVFFPAYAFHLRWPLPALEIVFSFLTPGLWVAFLLVFMLKILSICREHRWVVFSSVLIPLMTLQIFLTLTNAIVFSLPLSLGRYLWWSTLSRYLSWADGGLEVAFFVYWLVLILKLREGQRGLAVDVAGVEGLAGEGGGDGLLGGELHEE